MVFSGKVKKVQKQFNVINEIEIKKLGDIGRVD